MPWVVRFEDIDKPRVVSGARDGQLRDMAALGLIPDHIADQGENYARHQRVFDAFITAGLVYPCYCSRQDWRANVDNSASAPHGPVAVYSGRCRNLKAAPATDLPTLAWRLRMPPQDGGEDFIVARTSTTLATRGHPNMASFSPAYNLACAVDDYDGDHDLLVRAWDLAQVTPQQRAVQEKLAQLENKITWMPPAVFHCSLITRDDGGRLEKRTPGVTINELASAGIDCATILARFASSFTLVPGDFSRGRIWGETARELTLNRLLA